MAFGLIARLMARLPRSSTSASTGAPSSTSSPSNADDISSPTTYLTPASTPATQIPPTASLPSTTNVVSSINPPAPSTTSMVLGINPPAPSTTSVLPNTNSPDTSLIASPMTTSSSSSASSPSSLISQGTSALNPSISSVTSAKASTLPTTVSPKKSHQVADGAVAGAVIGVAVGIALITFLVTFLFMRRKRNATRRGKSVMGSASDGPGHQAYEKPKRAHTTRSNRDTSEYESYLPPSADDRAIEQRTKNTFDQIELHVENYYQNMSNTSTRPNDRELASFNSPYLPKSLASMLSHSRDGSKLIKHVLAYLVISSISPGAKPGSSLLPAEFVGLPTSAASTEFGPNPKPGFDQCMSRWRVLSAYLRPNPTENTLYTAHRDRQTTELTQLFSRSLAAWKNPKYSDDDRMRHLSAVFIEAADLGFWLFSQPSGFEFRWSRSGENEIETAPALVKVTDEKGQKLVELQVVVKATTSKLRS